MSSTQTLSPGGEAQSGISRFSSPRTALLEVAHEGIHPMNMLPPPMVALPLRVAPGTTITLLIPAENGYSSGRYPVSRFWWMVTRNKLLRFLTHNGNSPDSLLLLRCSSVRLDRFLSSDGIGPVRLLLLRVSVWRLVRLPSSDGIGPVRLLSPRVSVWRLVRLPSSGGSVPFSA